MLKMTFEEIFRMVKVTVNKYTYAGTDNHRILEAATQIYCKQMEVGSNAKNDNIIRQSNNEKEAGEASGN